MTKQKTNKKSLRPQPVVRENRTGGNLSPTVHKPVVGGTPSPAPTMSLTNTNSGGILLHREFKGDTVTFMPRNGFVVVLFVIQHTKYFNYISFDSFYLIKRIDEDTHKLYGRGIGLRRFISLCKKHKFDISNENYW